MVDAQARRLARDRLRALVSLAYGGEHPPERAASQLARAWDEYVATGIPRDPGWYAADHALEGGTTETPAMDAMVAAQDRRGIVVLRGLVGSGRSYAACRALWRRARIAARDGKGNVGAWLDAGIAAGCADWVSREERGRGDTRQLWGPVRDRCLSASVLVVDDAGAAGSTTGQGPARVIELLEARHRAAVGLTLVCTNLDKPAYTAIYGARSVDRSTWVEVEGSSLRGGDRPAPEVPAKVRLSVLRVKALGTVETAAERGLLDIEGLEEAQGIVETWLRGDLDASSWETRLAEELRVADEHQAWRSRWLAGAVEKMKLASEDTEAKRRADELRALRDQHTAKCEQLRGKRANG